jgi:type II secretory pathway predicted ATPase ExeA
MEYLRYWSFREPPFGPAASRFFFLGGPQREGFAWIQEQIRSESKISLLTSNGGCGVTTMFSRLASSNGFDDCAVEVICSSGRHPSIERVQADLARKMGIIVKRNSLGGISNEVELNRRRSIRFVWLIDGLGKHSADAAFQISRRCPEISIVGSVTPRLHKRVVRSLGKHIVQTSVDEFQENDTIAFIDHSMKTAGCRKRPFSPEAIRELHLASNGRIKAIAHLACQSLVLAARDEATNVSAFHIRRAAGDSRQAA